MQVLNAPAVFDEIRGQPVEQLGVCGPLAADTGVRLAATAAFDHPTPLSLAHHLGARLFGATVEPSPAIRLESTPDDEDPIAIVAMACRLPGGVFSPEDLWRLVEEGREGLGEFPDDRGWDLDTLFDPDPDRPGTSYVRTGGFLPGAGDFDAEPIAEIFRNRRRQPRRQAVERYRPSRQQPPE